MTSVFEKYEKMTVAELKKTAKVVRDHCRKFHRPEDNLLLMYIGELQAMHETKAEGTLSEYWDGRDSAAHPDARFTAPSWYFHRYLATKRRQKLDGDTSVSFDEPTLQFNANVCALIPVEERTPLMSRP